MVGVMASGRRILNQVTGVGNSITEVAKKIRGSIDQKTHSVPRLPSPGNIATLIRLC